MMYIFDLDDTLVHTHLKAYEKTVCTAKMFGRSFDFEQFKTGYGKMDFHSCVRLWFEGINPDEFRARYNSLRTSYPYEPIGDVLGLFSYICADNDIGIITNSSCEGTDFKLNCIGLCNDRRGIFRFIYHKGNMVKPKPDSAQIEILCKQGYRRDDMVYIGDNVRDYDFAQNSGIVFFAVLTGLETTDDFLRSGIPADRILEDVHGIRDRIK